jgi:hypothetical protein
MSDPKRNTEEDEPGLPTKGKILHGAQLKQNEKDEIQRVKIII